MGSKNDNAITRNNLSDPVITRYIRFNPRQWNNFISMRVEIYGCPFSRTISDVLSSHDLSLLPFSFIDIQF